MRTVFVTFCFFTVVLSSDVYAASDRVEGPKDTGCIGGGIEETKNSSSGVIFQVFPLAPRLRYLYNYRYEYAYGGLAPSNTETDTGFIEYTILDSSVENDSTVIWTVKEVCALWDSLWFGWKPDSVCTTADSTIISLEETTKGLHELTANGIVWCFPVAQEGSSVFRYSDSSALLLTASWTGGGGGGTVPFYGGEDSLLLSTGTGLNYVRIHTSDGFSPSYSEYYDISAHLVGSPSLGIKNTGRTVLKPFLFQNYPNPFNPSTTISFDIPKPSHVSLIIYDILGRRVETLVDGDKSTGHYQVTFNGSRLPSGVYFCRIQAGNYTATKKLMLMK